MKPKRLSGFSLELIALAVGNAYAEQFIQHNEYKHAVAMKDGKVEDIDNALVIITGNGSYGYPLRGRVTS